MTWMDLQTVIQSEVCQIVLNILKCPFLISALNLSELELNHLHMGTEPCKTIIGHNQVPWFTDVETVAWRHRMTNLRHTTMEGNSQY